MMRLIRHLLLPASAASVLLVVAGNAPAFIDRGEVAARTLPNGLTVLVREESAQKVVELQAWVGAGSRDEPVGREGIAHLFEHMLFKGAAARGTGEIAAAVEAAGGEINAYTSHDQTVYHVTISAAYFTTALAVLSDALQYPAFDPLELEREKKVVGEEIRQGRDQPVRVFSEKLFAAAYAVHPYGRPVIGTERSVSAVTRDDMLAFFRAWYVPANLKLVVVGGVRADDVFSRAASLFTVPAAPSSSRRIPTEPPAGSLRISRMIADTDPARISLAFPIGALTAPETPALDLLAAVLSQGESSRLPRELRDRGTVLSAWAGAWTPADPGLFMLGATVEQDRAKVEAAFSALSDQLRRLREEPVPPDELSRAREQMMSDKVFSRQQVEGQAREIGSSALLTGDPLWAERYYSRLQAVEPADILALARQVFRPDRAVAGFLSRREADQPGDAAVRALLDEGLAPVPASSAGGPAPETAAPGVLRRTLANGVTVLVREDRRLPVVAVKAGVPGGLRFEDEAGNGAFNLISGLLARGTAGYTADALSGKLDSMSASLSGFSGRNSFGVDGLFLSRDFPESLALAREVLTRAVFPEQELALAKGRVISGIRAKRDRLPAAALESFLATLYTRHPYRLPVSGTEESVGRLTREDLLARYRRALAPPAMVVSICGDVDAQDAFRRAEESFGDLAPPEGGPGPGAAGLPAEEALAAVREARQVRPGKEQTHLVLGFFGPTFRSGDREAVDVLNAVLAGQGGRLFAELRDKRSLAYSVGSFVSPGVEPGFFAFSIATSPAQEKESVEGFLREIRRVRDEEVAPAELDRARRYLAGGSAIGLQTAGARADQVFFAALYGQDLPRALAYPEKVAAVTASQVRAAALRYLDPDRYALAVVEAKK
jgi:zinc protease